MTLRTLWVVVCISSSSVETVDCGEGRTMTLIASTTILGCLCAVLAKGGED